MTDQTPHGRRFRALVLPWVLAVAAALGAATATVHVKLVRANLPDGAVLTASPARLQLWFNEAPLLGMSGGTLTGPNGIVTLAKFSIGTEHSLVVPISTAVGPGAYRFEWRTAGEDGHVITGVLSFSVKATSQAWQ